VLAIISLLFVILVLLFSISAVQTKVGKYVTKRLNEDFDTNINIERVGLQFNGDIELLDIYIEDHKNDTLISIKELNASILSFKKFYDNKLTFGDVDIYDLKLKLVRYKGENDTNLDVFVEKFEDDRPREVRGKFLMSSSDISINNGDFIHIDQNKKVPMVFHFIDLNINATDFLILGPDVSARINKLSLFDDRDLDIDNLSTNFKYTLTGMNFDNLKIQTEDSELNGAIKFHYLREDLQQFTNKVQIEARFEDSEIKLSDLDPFYDEFGLTQKVRFEAVLKGTLNDLNVDSISLSAGRQTRFGGTFNFQNLFDKKIGTFKMDGDINKMSSNYGDLVNLLPDVLGKSLPPELENIGQFELDGTALITPQKVTTDLEIDSELGYILTNLDLSNIDQGNATTYTGNLILDEFQLGTFSGNENIGNISLNVDVDGSGFTVETLNTQITGSVFGLYYNSYYYSNINISGNFQNKIFNGKLDAGDQNLNVNFDGLIDFSLDENIYDFTAQVNFIDFNKINFITRDSIAEFRGLVTMDMKGTNLDDAYGNINFENTLYVNQNGGYYFDDFRVTSRFAANNERYIEVNSPDIVEGRLKGKFRFDDIAKLVENSLGNIYTNYDPHEIEDGQYIDFNFRIYNKIAEVFYPGLKLGTNTFIRGRVESDARNFTLTFKSPEIQLEENIAKDVQLQLNNKNPIFNTYIEINSINSKYYDLSKFSLINVTHKDTLFIKTEFNGGKANRDNFDLNLFYTINEDARSVLGFKKSKINFKENDWFINERRDRRNKLIFDRLFEMVELDNFIMSHQDEQLQLTGLISGINNKEISLHFQDVDLEKITPDIDSLTLGGNVNGKFRISEQKGFYLPESNVTIDNFKVNQFNLGSFKANIRGDDSLTDYDVDISLQEDSNETLLARGNINVEQDNSTLDLDIHFDRFILDPLNPFGAGNITNIRGEVKGYAQVTGRLQRPDISGELSIDDAGLTIPYLNIDYAFEDETQVTLREQSFIFNNAELTDSEYFSRANLNGQVNHYNLSNWVLDLDFNSERLLVLNTEDSENALYYGTAFVNGNIDIAGPADQLVIKADVSSEEGTVFIIPLNDTETFGDNSFIHFLSPEEKRARLSGEQVELTEIRGLEMDFDLDINQNAEMEIVVDRESGSTIRGRGEGNLLAQINTNGKFNMYGDFLVFEGVYNFLYGGLVQKRFDVVPGGVLEWEGDPLKAAMNIKAIHRGIEANPSILLDNPINQSIPVEVEIHLTGELEQPSPTFDIKFPSVNSTLNSELQYRLDDNDSRQMQALWLLSTGSFRSELSVQDTDLYGLVSGRISSMLRDILSSGDGTFEVGVDLDLAERNPNYETDSKVGLTLSTRLSDKVLINGKVGVPIGGVSETVVAGNFEVQVLINEERTLSLKFFNRENNIRYFGEQIGYTQGVGLSYDVEFDNLAELFSKIFKGNKKKEQIKTDLQKKEENVLPEYMSFKKKETKN
jgi:hypothetical protein